MNHCLNCNIETNNPKFCSISCGASFNNRQDPKVKRKGRCRVCQAPIPGGRTYCPLCFESHRAKDWNRITLLDYMPNSQQRHSRIRGMARDIYRKSGRKRACAICNYDLHIDICHIIDIKDFPLDTPVAVVNALSNLIGLCKNHHWEFDHELLDITSVMVGLPGIEPGNRA